MPAPFEPPPCEEGAFDGADRADTERTGAERTGALGRLTLGRLTTTRPEDAVEEVAAGRLTTRPEDAVEEVAAGRFTTRPEEPGARDEDLLMERGRPV